MKADHYSHGWLPVAVPASARRFRVADASLAAVLADAGAEVVDGDAEVEIAASADAIRGEAPLAIVAVDPAARAAGPLVLRAGSRLSSSLRTRRRAARALASLRRLGYDASVLLWDVAHPAAIPGLPAPDRRLSERLPERALVVGRRGSPQPTAVEAALEAAAAETGLDLRPRWASIRSGTAVVATDAGVLRLAIGRGRFQIESQAAALDALRRAGVPPVVGDRVPWLLAEAETGLVRWSLERLLPGERPSRDLTPGLLGDCVEFLVALHRAPGGRAGGPSLEEHAETVAAVCGTDAARAARGLGERLEEELSGLGRGFAHGDFFAGNLLAGGARLEGVLDWDGGGPGRPPLVDLLHLELTSTPYGGDDEWGRAVLERLLPEARAGGDETVRRYCAEVGVDADAAVLEALVLAYWLEYAAYQLRTHLDRRSQRSWIEGNLERVLRAVATGARGRGARTPTA